jgi:hypothetical protein
MWLSELGYFIDGRALPRLASLKRVLLGVVAARHRVGTETKFQLLCRHRLTQSGEPDARRDVNGIRVVHYS